MKTYKNVLLVMNFTSLEKHYRTKNITDTSIYYTIYVIKPFIIKKQNPDMAWL